MRLKKLLGRFFGRSAKRGKSDRQRRRCRPLLEQLETRVVPAVDLNTLFELDGNAVTGTLHTAPIPAGSSTTTSHDWDQVYADFLAGNTATSGAGVVAFVTDATGVGSTSFTSGSHEDGDISTWGWQTPEHSEDKNDILHAMVAGYIQGGDLFIFFGADRFATNGDSKIGFWFFQNTVGLNPDGTFSGAHTVGDILIESTFTNGGGVSTIQVYRWVGSGGNNGSLDLLVPQPSEFAIVNDATNTNAQNQSPWPYDPKTGPADRFPTGAFYEGGVNLTGILEATGVLQPGDCLNFSSFMATSRSSASLSSALDDFALGQANISTCGSISWEKRDGTGALLGGATFEISPDPTGPTGNVDVLQVVDNTGQQGYTGADVDPTPGVFKVIDVHPGTYTITETVPPPNYFLDPAGNSHTVVVPETGNLDVSIGTMGQNDATDFHNFKPGINIVKSVNGQDANSPTGPHVATRSTVTFTYVVTNTGDVPLANVAVSDDILGPITSFTGDTNGNGLLDLTETWTYTKTVTAQPGQQTNIGTATGQAVGQTVSDNDPANYFGDNPGINIVKFVNGQDTDQDCLHVAAGTTVTFTYVVTNTGNVPLANVSVNDDVLGPITSFTGDTNGNGLLDQAETWTYTKTATAQPGEHHNTGTATGADTFIPGLSVSDDNPACYFGDKPEILLVKTGTLDLGANGIADPGDLIHYTFTVTNTGNVTLTNVTLSDLIGGVTVGPLIDSALGNGATVLAVGEVETATGTYAITQADIDAGTKFNVAKATGLSTTTEESVESNSNAIVPIPAPAPTLALGQLSGTVYVDLNNNGRKDKREKGIAGVTVQLLGVVNGVITIVATTKTNAKGNYSFSNLAPGVYRVVERQPRGFRDGKETLGRIKGILAGLIEANDRFFVSLLRADRGVDYNFGERVSKTRFI